MKRIFSTFILAICCSSLFISCSKDNNNDPDNPPNVETYLSKETIKESNNGTIYTDISMYFYDNSKRLMKIVRESSHSKSSSEVDFIYNTDGTLKKTVSSNDYVESFYYENNKIQKVVYSGINGNDTLFLFYNINGRLEKTIHNRPGMFSTKVNESVDYTLGNDGKITKKIGSLKQYDGENNLWDYSIDTIYFEYSSNNNLTSENRYKTDMLTNERTWSKYEYKYDSKLNYWLTKHFPQEYLFIELLWPDRDYSTNNITLTTYNSSSGTYDANIRNITNYNTNGYPLIITANWGSIELEYSEN